MSFKQFLCYSSVRHYFDRPDDAISLLTNVLLFKVYTAWYISDTFMKFGEQCLYVCIELLLPSLLYCILFSSSLYTIHAMLKYSAILQTSLTKLRKCKTVESSFSQNGNVENASAKQHFYIVIINKYFPFLKADKKIIHVMLVLDATHAITKQHTNAMIDASLYLYLWVFFPFDVFYLNYCILFNWSHHSTGYLRFPSYTRFHFHDSLNEGFSKMSFFYWLCHGMV